MNANTKWEVGVASDLYDAGTNEDGEMMEGLSFYLVAEAPNGRRFTHFERFLSPSRGWLQSTEGAVNRLLARVQAAQASGKWTTPEGSVFWTEVAPAYGSEAYAANWVEYEADRKCQEAAEAWGDARIDRAERSHPIG